MKKIPYTVAVLIHLALYGATLTANASELTSTTGHENIQTDKSSKHPPASDKQVDSTIVVSAQIQNLLAPGVSAMTADDIRKNPPARDISELIRTMPGVNLTGNSTSGQRGNNRQIDIRGMGPENTLILIDGKPVTSRASVRFGWRGERDTRGDSNWVPPEMIERIEVIRGPAAARYGNGAAGGVINIITRRSSSRWHGTWNGYANLPESSKEGSTARTNFSLSGPLAAGLSFMLWGDLDRSQPDAWDINAGHQSLRTGQFVNTLPAGREGVTNKDISGQIRWEFAKNQFLEFEANYNRQSNLYAGDTQNTNNAYPWVQNKYGQQTNRLYRQNYSVVWQGAWDNGVSTNNYVQYTHTRNSRLDEGLAGGTEGLFTKDAQFVNIDLANWQLHGEVTIPFRFLLSQNMTLGTEWNQQRMQDNASNTQTTAMGGTIRGVPLGKRSPHSSANIFSLFAEDNILLTDSSTLTPALRFDHHSIAGSNWSPSLNLSWQFIEDWTLKMGIARAYKAPNLYQTNPNYILFSRGNGCYASGNGTHCYLMGNRHLKAETSVNKEVGVQWAHSGYQAGVTWFRNDYRNKIESGLSPVAKSLTRTSDIYLWENVPKAVVEGLEGSVNIPLPANLTWRNNITWMLQSKNEQTGDRLSVIPQFTLNSTLDWQIRENISVQGTFTWYGRQKPKLYNYKGQPTTGSERHEVSPYSVVGLSASWDATKNIRLTAGVDNIFDKRQWRAGNAQTTGGHGSAIDGAGAATYNEPGRTWYLSVNTHF